MLLERWTQSSKGKKSIGTINDFGAHKSKGLTATYFFVSSKPIPDILMLIYWKSNWLFLLAQANFQFQDFMKNINSNEIH